MLKKKKKKKTSPAIDLMIDLQNTIGWKLRRLNEKKKSIDDCVGEACDSTR